MAKRHGFSLLGVVISLALLGVAGLGLVKMLAISQRASRNLSAKTDLDLIRQMIFAYVDCDATFATGHTSAVDPASATDCDSTSDTQSDPYLRIRRRTLDGSTKYLTDILDTDGSAILGSWRVRASCSSSEQTLVIQAIPAEDRNRNWAEARLIFGTGGKAFPLCYGAVSAPFTGTVTYPWSNPACSYDVNNDNMVTAIDALVIINKLNSTGEGPLTSGSPPPYYDVNKNNYVDKGDALSIINCLNSGAPPCNLLPCNDPNNQGWPGVDRFPFYNTVCPMDTNGDHFISPIDSLVIINELNANGTHVLYPDTSGHSGITGNPPQHGTAPPFIDPDRDNQVTNNDAQMVINHLNAVGPGPCP